MKIFRKHVRFFVLTVIAVMIALLFVVWFIVAGKSYEIMFPVELPPSISESTVIEYDASALEAKLKGEVAYIYCNPTKTDYSIVEKFGFNISNYDVLSERRWYKIGSGENEARLEIDAYGCFYYSSKAPDTSFDLPFTDEELYRIAKEFLQKYDLWSDNFSSHSFGGNSILSSAESSKVVARKVYFHQQFNGKPRESSGTVSVEINGNGEVTTVNYKILQHNIKVPVMRITLEDAIQNIKVPDKAYVVMNSPTDKLLIEDVSISYWSETLNYSVLQPVYVFTGKSITSDGETEDFSITVQANTVNLCIPTE